VEDRSERGTLGVELDLGQPFGFGARYNLPVAESLKRVGGQGQKDTNDAESDNRRYQDQWSFHGILLFQTARRSIARCYDAFGSLSKLSLIS